MPLAAFTRWRRSRLARRPLPHGWATLLLDRLPFYEHLDGDERDRFVEHLTIFFHEKQFEGVGIEVTDEMKILVSAVAARLSRNIGFHVYDELGSIVMYPSTVRLPRTGAGPSGHDASQGNVHALGVAHPWGTVVLAWDAVQKGLKDHDDGHDTALHELAHIIDMADGAADGTPILDKASAYRVWADVFTDHYEQLRRRPHGQVLRAYGATNEAEFFAVASEAFFERPAAMKKRHRELYDALAGYYQIEPTVIPRRQTLGGRRRSRRKRR